jgi:hypothetical protein
MGQKVRVIRADHLKHGRPFKAWQMVDSKKKDGF